MGEKLEHHVHSQDVGDGKAEADEANSYRGLLGCSSDPFPVGLLVPEVLVGVSHVDSAPSEQDDADAHQSAEQNDPSQDTHLSLVRSCIGFYFKKPKKSIQITGYF